MIRFMQTSATFKKYVLTSILVVICVAMAWYLVPSFTGQGLGNSPNNPVLATVAGSDITTAAVRKQAIQMIEQQYPNARGQAATLVPFVAVNAKEQLINQKVLLAEARRMGFKATPDDIRQELEHGELAATFFPGGKFIGMQAYEDLLASHDLTREEFEQSIGDSILIRKLQAAVSGGATVTDTEVRKEFEKRYTKVKFDYAVLKKDDILKTLHPTEPEQHPLLVLLDDAHRHYRHHQYNECDDDDDNGRVHSASLRPYGSAWAGANVPGRSREVPVPTDRTNAHRHGGPRLDLTAGGVLAPQSLQAHGRGGRRGR